MHNAPQTPVGKAARRGDAGRRDILRVDSPQHHRGRTVVVVAHRLSTVKDADKILALLLAGWLLFR